MRFIVLAFLTLLLACTSNGGGVVPPRDLALEHLVLEPGEKTTIRIPPDPHRGPAELSPQVYLDLVITDESGNTLIADRVQLGEQTVARNVNRAVMQIPGTPQNPYVVRVFAPGFQPWVLSFRFNFKHSRHFMVPVRMKRVAD